MFSSSMCFNSFVFVFLQFLCILFFQLKCLWYAVRDYWCSWATWICKESTLEYWSWSPTISSKYFSQGLRWLNPQALWRRSENLASQVHISIRGLIYLIMVLNWHFNFSALLQAKLLKVAWNIVCSSRKTLLFMGFGCTLFLKSILMCFSTGLYIDLGINWFHFYVTCPVYLMCTFRHACEIDTEVPLFGLRDMLFCAGMSVD